jgi:transposase
VDTKDSHRYTKNGGSLMVKRIKRSYTPEFKREAVRLVLTTEKSCVEVSEELGCSKYVLYRWLKKYNEEGSNAFSNNGQNISRDEELELLRKEVDTLRQENEILKKAVAIFSHRKR